MRSREHSRLLLHINEPYSIPYEYAASFALKDAHYAPGCFPPVQDGYTKDKNPKQLSKTNYEVKIEMLNEEKICSRMVEMASRSDGRKGLYCICSHMGWPGFLSDGGRVEIPLEGIPGHIKIDSIRIDRRIPGEWLHNYRVSAEKIYFSNYIPGEVMLKTDDRMGREKNIVLHVKIHG